MTSKGRQLSVLIAGATGSTGCELVSRLVSHPDVGRVVALSRKPIPLNRWRSKFPNIHTGDALRCLSVVSVDWNKILADASHIPTSYVREGHWSGSSGTNSTVRSGWWGMHSMTGLCAGGFVGGDGKGVKAWDGAKQSGAFAGQGDARGKMSRGGSGVIGYVKVPDDMLAGTRVQGKDFMDNLLQTTFYKSVFSGHHIAINCLGSKNFFRRSEVDAVDHQYAIAFAKMVRVFNCTVHAEPLEEDDGDFLMGTHSAKLDSVLWEEICAACYGQGGQNSLHRGVATGVAGNNSGEGSGDRSNSSNVVSSWSEQQPSRGGDCTLLQFVQVSVMGSSLWSPFPYFRAHGVCDEELLGLFNRDGYNMCCNSPHRRAFPQRRQKEEEEEEEDVGSGNDKEAVARQRAEMLVRRSPVTVWDNSHITIWRPGLLRRDKQRFVERLLGVFFAGIDVHYFADVIVDDIISSVKDERRFDEVGSAKIVGGNGVAVRVKMKRLEAESSRCETSAALDASKAPAGTPVDV